MIYADTDTSFVAYDRDRVWCPECNAKVWLEVTTKDGRLITLPLDCGHKYDPTAKEPVPKPGRQSGPGRECAGCPTTIYGNPRKIWCYECSKLARARSQRAYAERQRAG